VEVVMTWRPQTPRRSDDPSHTPMLTASAGQQPAGPQSTAAMFGDPQGLDDDETQQPEPPPVRVTIPLEQMDVGFGFDTNWGVSEGMVETSKYARGVQRAEASPGTIHWFRVPSACGISRTCAGG
jgi:hypothetical protein